MDGGQARIDRFVGQTRRDAVIPKRVQVQNARDGLEFPHERRGAHQRTGLPKGPGARWLRTKISRARPRNNRRNSRPSARSLRPGRVAVDRLGQGGKIRRVVGEPDSTVWAGGQHGQAFQAANGRLGFHEGLGWHPCIPREKCRRHDAPSGFRATPAGDAIKRAVEF